MTGGRHAAMAWGSPAVGEWCASLCGAGAIVELRAEAVTFSRQRGDVLVLDHMLTAHGRRPFTGARRVLVAMGNSYLDAVGRAPAGPEADRRT